MGEYIASTNPETTFTAPILGGRLKHSNIARDYGVNAHYRRISPEGVFEYLSDVFSEQFDTRGAATGTEEPTVDIGGNYPASSDPSVLTRCAEGGIPQSCDMESRFNEMANRIDNLLWDNRERDNDNTGGGGGAIHEGGHASTDKADESKQESSEAQQTTQTSKPEPESENSGPVDPASVPDENGNDKGTIYGPANGESYVPVKIGYETVDASSGSLWEAPFPSDNDCLDFVTEIGRMAAKSKDGAELVRELYNRYKDGTAADYQATGFRTEFVDDNSSDSANQVRHAAGAIFVGYNSGLAYFGALVAGGPTALAADAAGARDAAVAAAIRAFDSREVSTTTAWVPSGNPKVGPVPQTTILPTTKAQQVDKNLNAAVIPIGFRLGTGQINKDQLADRIQDSICK